VDVHSSKFSSNLVRPLAVFGQAHLLLNGSIVSNNSVIGGGGGLRLEGRANVTITGGSRVQGNNATQDGGGLLAYNSTCVSVLGSSIDHNKAGWGGGIQASGAAHVMLDRNSSVHGNTAEHNGGGLGLYDSATLSLTGGSSVYGNTARDFGGGLSVSDNATVSLTGSSSVHNNIADGGGGLILFANATISLTGGRCVHGNTAGGSGGGAECDGACHCIPHWRQQCARQHCWLLWWRAALWGNPHVSLTGGGGLNNATVSLTGGSSVHGNTAGGFGGGLSVSENATVALTDGSSVHGNRAVNGCGGGLNVAAGARVAISDRSTIFNNTCFGSPGGGIAIDLNKATFDSRGRAVADADARRRFILSYVTISNSTVSNNTSIRSAGGGLAVGRNGTIELVNGTVLSLNSDINGAGGGVVLLGNGTLHADASVVFVNSVVSRGYVGSTIAAFDNSKLHLPVRGGNLTKCSVGVYLGWSTCEAGEFSQADMCVCCPQHTFSFTNASCEPCPANGKCAGGSLVQPPPGYWSSAPTSVQMHHCPLTTTACNYTDPDHKCNEGYTGPICGACQLPQYGMLGPFECGKCMDRRVQLALYLSVSGVSVVFVTYTVHATWKDNLTGDKVVLATDLIKVLVLYLQYTAIIGSVSVPWPLFNLKRWFQAVNVVFAGPCALVHWWHARGCVPGVECCSVADWVQMGCADGVQIGFREGSVNLNQICIGFLLQICQKQSGSNLMQICSL
jgi:hypothetical protein